MGPQQSGDDGAGVLYALFVAARSADPLMQTHAMMFLAAFIIGAFALISHVSSAKPVDPSAYETDVIKAGVIASVFWGIAGFLVGVVFLVNAIFVAFAVRSFPGESEKNQPCRGSTIMTGLMSARNKPL